MDLRWQEHWARCRLEALGNNPSTLELREALGSAPLLSVAHMLPPQLAHSLRAACGVTNLQLQGALTEWALQLAPQDFPRVRRAARNYGIGPVLAALDLVGAEHMYMQLAQEQGVDTTRGLKWR